MLFAVALIVVGAAVMVGFRDARWHRLNDPDGMRE